MYRLADWEQRLADYLGAASEMPHEYGQLDCALHGANAALAITGVDHGRPFRGRYRTALGAARMLRRYGAGTIEATFDRDLAVIPPAFAQRGDLVLADGSVGVCIGGEALFVGEQGGHSGLVRVPRREWSKAWAVGRDG